MRDSFDQGRSLSQVPLSSEKATAVVHQRQAGVLADDDAIGRDAEHRREQRAQLRQTLQLAVVAAVDVRRT